MRRQIIFAAFASSLLAAGACAPQDEAATDSSGGDGGGSCSPADLQTLEADTLTIATDEPAYAPWMVDDEPTSGEGFESAVAYAVAEQLGYSQDQVTWTRVPFNVAIQPGDKPFDFDINQFSISEERQQAVDFSSPYYTVAQALVAIEGNPAADAGSLADLQDLRLGAQVATTSLQILTDVIAPTTEPSVFNSNDDAKLALQNGQIDGLVVDLPTAYFISNVELDGGVLVGQLPGGEGGDEFGLLLAKDSPLTDCVSQAVDALREDGTLDELEQEWLSDVIDAPVLE